MMKTTSQFQQTFKSNFKVSPSEKMFQSPTRRQNQPQTINVISEMLGAGTDPLAKN